MIKKISVTLLAITIVFSLNSCYSDSEAYSKSYFDYFDTVISVKAYCSSRDDFESLCKTVEKTVGKYDKLFDIYNDFDGINNLKTVNDFAGIKAVSVDKEVIEFLKYCKDIYSTTDGNVNICLGPVLKIWHRYREKGVSIPSKKELKNANKFTDINNLIIDEVESTVFLKNKQSCVDVGAVAKGYVGEVLKKEIIKSGLSKNFIIDLGGNIIAIGKKSGNRSFSVAIADPDNTAESVLTVNVEDKAVVTSGDYQRFYEVNSKRYSHIISPKTLFPATYNRSVTVISDDSAFADVLSTALFIMQTDDAIEYINGIENCEVLIIDSNNNLRYSDGFKEYIE